MTPEPQEQENESHSWESPARDDESAEIVRQLERGLPRWEGGHNRGWMDDFPGVMIYFVFLCKIGLLSNHALRMLQASTLKFSDCSKGTKTPCKPTQLLGQHRSMDVRRGQRPWSSLEEVPEDAQVKDLSFNVHVLLTSC